MGNKSKEKAPSLIDQAEAAKEKIIDAIEDAIYWEGNLDEAERLSSELYQLSAAIGRIKDIRNQIPFRSDWMIIKEKIAWYKSLEEVS